MAAARTSLHLPRRMNPTLKAIIRRAQLNSERALVARKRARTAIDPHWLIALGWALVGHAGGAPGWSSNLAADLLSRRQHSPFDGSCLSCGGHCERQYQRQRCQNKFHLHCSIP